MARIQGVPSTTKNLLLRLIFWFARRRFGKSVAPLHGYARNGAVLAAMAGLEMGMERASRLPTRVKMLAELRVAALVGCEFCLDVGSMLSRKAGLREDQLRELHCYADSEVFSEMEKGVLVYADRMTHTPVTVEDADLDRLRAFFDEPQIVELTAAIAHENLRARMNHALGYGSEGFTQGGACAIPVRRGPAAARPAGG